MAALDTALAKATNPGSWFIHVEALGEVGLRGTYHDKNGFSGTVKYLGQRPKVVVSIDVPSGASVSQPSRVI
jgi:NAD(P)H-hydrate repair Nnr-like enzyme with NAD(P)H-hydrate epimerase domain